MNVLMAVDEVVVPVTGDYYPALHGVSRFMQILDHIDTALERETQAWIALTRFNERRRLPRAPSFGKSIFEYRSRGKGAGDHRTLAQDVMNRRTL